VTGLKCHEKLESRENALICQKFPVGGEGEQKNGSAKGKFLRGI